MKKKEFLCCGWLFYSALVQSEIAYPPTLYEQSVCLEEYYLYHHLNVLFNPVKQSITQSVKKRRERRTPVPVDMGCTKSKAVVKKSGVNNSPTFRPFQQITQVTQMSVTTSNSVPGTVLIQDKHLARAKPSLHDTNTRRGGEGRDHIAACHLTNTQTFGDSSHSPSSRRCHWACGPTWAAAPSQKAKRGQSYRG